MTLVLAVSTMREVVHVSDRRVTLSQRGRTPSIHSPMENKALIFQCSDAVGVIGYTGSAYIGTCPTDQWIASILAPQDAGSPPLGTFALGGRGFGKAGLQHLVGRLRKALIAVRLPRGAEILQISIAGFRIRRKRWIPFILEIQWKRPLPTIGGFMRGPRSPVQTTAISQIGDVFADGDDLIRHIEAGAKEKPLSPERLLTGMIHAVRVRSGQTMTVGADLISVTIPHPRLSRQIMWTFEPSVPHRAAVVSKEWQQEFSAVYSPWMIGPSMVCCPMVSGGGFQVGLGAVVVNCRTVVAGHQPAQTGGSVLFAASHQERTSRP